MMEQTNESALQRRVYSIELSEDELKKHLHYDPKTGIWTWLTPTSYQKIGSVAGHLDESKGYVIISFKGRHYYSHVLAWFYTYGVWRRVDHKDTIGCNDRLSNLREANSQQNNRNQCVRIDNMLGVKGVTRSGRKFMARICVDKQSIYLGTFDTLEQAIEVRKAAANRYFGDFVHESEREPQAGELD